MSNLKWPEKSYVEPLWGKKRLSGHTGRGSTWHVSGAFHFLASFQCIGTPGPVRTYIDLCVCVCLLLPILPFSSFLPLFLPIISRFILADCRLSVAFLGRFFSPAGVSSCSTPNAFCSKTLDLFPPQEVPVLSYYVCMKGRIRLHAAARLWLKQDDLPLEPWRAQYIVAYPTKRSV